MAQIDSVGQALKALKRRAALAVMVFLLGCAATLFVVMNHDRVYVATASVQIETPRIALDGSAMRGGSSIDNRIILIEQRLMSRDTLERIIADNNLFADIEGLSTATRVALLREMVTISRIMDMSMGWRPDAQSTGLLISVQMGNAQIAADVANTFLEMVLSEGRNRATSRAEDTLSFFAAEEQRVTGQMTEVESRIAALKTEYAGALPDAAGIRAEQLQQLRAAQLALEQQIITFEQGRDRLRFDEAARQEAIFAQQAGLVTARIEEIRALNDIAPEVERQLNQMERTRARLQEEFTAITTRRAGAAMTQLLESRDQSDRFEVLEHAIAPEEPVGSSRRKLLMMGIVASLLGALGVALGLEWISPYLRTSAQIERTLGLRPVVVIPDLRVPRSRRLT
jgi:tyrosine-protein kinase Etk/Wzc